MATKEKETQENPSTEENLKLQITKTGYDSAIHYTVQPPERSFFYKLTARSTNGGTTHSVDFSVMGSGSAGEPLTIGTASYTNGRVTTTFTNLLDDDEQRSISSDLFDIIAYLKTV